MHRLAPPTQRKLMASDVHLKQIDRAVLLALHAHADNRTGLAYPSQRTIARLTGYCERAVRNSVLRLERERWIERDRNAGAGRRSRLTRYWLTVPAYALSPMTCGTQGAVSPYTEHAAPSVPLLSSARCGMREHDMRHVGPQDAAPSVPPNSLELQGTLSSPSPPARSINRSSLRLRSTRSPERVKDSLSELRRANPRAAQTITEIAAKLRVRWERGTA